MTVRQWLDTITLTKPVTVEDMRQLHGLIKERYPDSIVDAWVLSETSAAVVVELDGHRVKKVYDAR